MRQSLVSSVTGQNIHAAKLTAASHERGSDPRLVRILRFVNRQLVVPEIEDVSKYAAREESLSEAGDA